MATLLTQPAEKRQIAKVLEFSQKTARHINWDSVAADARELGAHFDARFQDGACTVTMFWAYQEEEVG